MNRAPTQAVVLWVLSVLAATCTLGVISLERATAPVRAPLGPPARVGLISLAANPPASEGLAAWERGAELSGLRAERVAVASLVDVAVERFAVWVLAEQAQLSDVDWAALDAFAALGGGIVLTGAAGLRDLEGVERERLPLRRLFPAHEFERSAARPGALRVGPRGPLVVGLAPGGAIPLAAGADAARIATTTGGALTWDGEPGSGAVLAGLHRGTPVVWLGCGLDAIAVRETAAQLAANVLRYASREAMLDLQPWPDGAMSAALLGIEVGSDLGLAARAARSLVERGIRPLLVVAPEIAEADPDGARQIAALGEIAVALGSAPAPGSAQKRVARVTGRAVRGAAGAGAAGAALDPASFDFAALEAAEVAVPEIGAGGVVALPRSGPVAPAAADEAERAEALLAAFAHSEALGGLYHVLLQPQWLAGASLPVAQLLSAQLETHSTWLAEPGELARWWRERRGVEARLAQAREGEWIVRASNSGPDDVRGVTLRIYLPAGLRRPRLDDRGWFAPRPRVRYASDHTWMELILPELAAGAAVQYTLLL